MSKDEKRGAVVVANQSCFHRDMLDGEQIALKTLKFHLLPYFQVVTLAFHCRSDRDFNERSELTTRPDGTSLADRIQPQN
jgi:hypothetical protein